jgi:acetylornithine deacetylase/succinyl-diaminopimelate desuccinylase-like protein
VRQLDSEVSESVFGFIEPDELCQLALDLCAISSPTGDEEALGSFILDWFEDQGLSPVRQEVEEGRINAVGILRGEDGNPSLTLNGHMDISSAYRHEDIVGLVPKPPELIEPYQEDGILYGTGMENMKSGLAAIMGAAAAISRSGVRLQGDLIVACVAGEVARASVDQYQGRHFRSEGVGTRYLLTHGMVSDYAIVADTSHFGVTWAECGAVYAKVTLRGRGAFTPFTTRSKNRRESRNPIIAMGPVIDALEQWASDYEDRNIYPFAGGEVHPKVSINAIAANTPFKTTRSPDTCSLYVDIRTPPNRKPIEVQRELRSALRAVPVDCTIEFFGSQRGYEGVGVEPLLEAIQAAHEQVVGGPTPPIDPAETSMWTDTNLYNEVGIPAVKFGIGAALQQSSDGELSGMTRILKSTRVDDLINATKIYAAAALKICGGFGSEAAART